MRTYRHNEVILIGQKLSLVKTHRSMCKLTLTWFNFIFGLTLFAVRHAVLPDCATNADCEDGCCTYNIIIIGKRGRFYPDGSYHSCEPWLNESSKLCHLNWNYSPTTQIYQEVCPCKPGLKCMPSDDLDPKYSKEWFGKCTPA